MKEVLFKWCQSSHVNLSKKANKYIFHVKLLFFTRFRSAAHTVSHICSLCDCRWSYLQMKDTLFWKETLQFLFMSHAIEQG